MFRILILFCVYSMVGFAPVICAAQEDIAPVERSQMPPAPQASTKNTGPALYDDNGQIIDPLCFLNNSGSENDPAYPTHGCDSDGLTKMDEIPLDPQRFVSASYIQRNNDVSDSAAEEPEPGTEDEGNAYPGFIGYRSHGQIRRGSHMYDLVTVVENGGGSGIFTTLMLLERGKDSDTGALVLRLNETIAGGDRCNGGIKDVQVSDDRFKYETNVTMYDMFFLNNSEEKEVLQSGPIDYIPSCANCCFATAQFDENGLILVTFGEESDAQQDPDTPAACVQNIIDMNVSGDNKQFTPEEFAMLTQEMERQCLGSTKRDE